MKKEIKLQPNHPLAELLGRKLIGIEVVPQREQMAMVKEAIKDSVEWADEATKKAYDEGYADCVWENDLLEDHV